MKYRIKAKIDCASCAEKAENELRKIEGIESASFNFPRSVIIVRTNLSEEEVKNHLKKINREIEFPEEKGNETEIFPIVKTALALAILILSWILSIPALAVASYIIAGYDVLITALRNIAKGKIFDENFLMAIATVGAIIIAAYDEAAGVMIFYQIGEIFEEKATGNVRKSINSLLNLSSDETDMYKDGEFVKVPSVSVPVGSLIKVKMGENIPIDGVVVSGLSVLDTKAVTGESENVKVAEGSTVLSGSINEGEVLIIRTTALFEDSTATKILKLTKECEENRAPSEKFITKFSRYYTPFVCISAFLLAAIPPLLFKAEWKDSLYRACVLLVISCPCALVLSVPLTYFASMGSFAKRGILVKGDESIQKLSKMSTLVMDKTGTLTEGVFSVRNVVETGGTEDEILSIATSLEKNSNHPIGSAILSLGIKSKDVTNASEIPGVGLKGTMDGHEVMIGSEKLNTSSSVYTGTGSVAYVLKDGDTIGYIEVSDKIRDGARDTIGKLKSLGVSKIIMLSGDRNEKAEITGKSLGLDESIGNLLPDEKLTALERIMSEGGVTAYAGDGINDAPSLAYSDVGIAMGGVGSDAAIEASDMVIMNDDISKIALSLRIAKKTERIVRENIWGSLIVKATVFVLAVMGISDMWAAVFADTGVLFIAVLNSLRALGIKKD